MIDLHVHSKASDGVLRPKELVELAHRLGLSALALTDHDTLDGVWEARAAGNQLGIEVISGVEISVNFDGSRSGNKNAFMHLLIYFAEPGGVIDKKLGELKRWRMQRSELIIEKLNRLGIRITADEVALETGGGQAGRPHLARVMVSKGYVYNVQEAFQKYLSRGAAAYVDKKRLEVKEALALCRGQPVVPVLGHPYSLALEWPRLAQQLSFMKSLGLRGVEVIYPEHDADFRKQLSQLAKELGLIITGGSDFHGDRPEPALGSGKNGNVAVEESVLESLRNARP